MNKCRVSGVRYLSLSLKENWEQDRERVKDNIEGWESKMINGSNVIDSREAGWV